MLNRSGNTQRSAAPFALLVALLGLLLAVPAAHAEAEPPPPLVIAQDRAWPPFAWLDDHGAPQGLLVELWQQIGHQLGRPITFDLADWGESIERVRRGEADLHGGLFQSAERSEFFTFTAPLFHMSAHLFLPSHSMAMTVDDAIAYRIGVLTGSYEAMHMAQHHPAIARVYYPNNEAMILAAASGKVDGFVADYPVAMYLLSRLASPGEFRALPGLYTQGLRVGLRLEDEALQEAVDEAIATLDPNDVQRMMNRWLYTSQLPVEVEVVPRWLLPAALLFTIGLVSLSLLGYALLLRHQRHLLAQQVAEQTTTLRHSHAREQRRSHILSLLSSDQPIERVLEAIVLDYEAEHPGALCSILLADPAGHRLRLAAAPSLPGSYNQTTGEIPIDVGAGACGTAAATAQPVIHESIIDHPYWQTWHESVKATGLHACWSYPVLSSKGRVLATFAIYHRQPCSPERSQITHIFGATDLARLAIERRQSERALVQRGQLEELVRSISTDFLALTDDALPTGIRNALARTASHCHADRCSVIELSGNDLQLRFTWHASHLPPHENPPLPLSYTQLSDWLSRLYNYQPLQLHADRVRNTREADRQLLDHLAIRSLVAVPIFQGGDLNGLLLLESLQGHHWDEVELAYIQLIANLMGSRLARVE